MAGSLTTIVLTDFS